ncbi:helix-turn-helix transcriptional regulator [Pararhodobacter marinus]|uniref:helix-turn-helix transcriptional regulator n=1 Tax=Pararhodobacter marinus TaxID=2184063 RepID=UPI003514C981
MSSTHRLTVACLDALGGAGFAPALEALAEATGARQLMVFEIGATGARCLMSRNYAAPGMAEILAAEYLNGWFRRDPLLPALRRLAPGRHRVLRVRPDTSGMAADYRRIFFDAPGLAGKTAVLCAGTGRRLIVNLYEAEDGASDADLADLLALLVARHFEAAPVDRYAALSGLSARERDVCLGILAGQTADAIAHDMGLSAATVTTYRKRAYLKLGLTSRSALFALCRAGD